MVRCFVGIMAPENIRLRAVAMQKELVNRQSGLGLECKLVEPENMHVCLSFLGEVDEKYIETVKSKLDGVAARHEKFNVKIGSVKFVPDESYIRVMVLDVADASGALEKLMKEIVAAVGGDSKPPHLTLCRVKHVEDKKRLVRSFGSAALDESFVVDNVQLIKSELQRSGPVYTVLHESKLLCV